MNQGLSSLNSCTSVQKRAVFKIAVELVKADNKIHSREISVLDSLQDVLGLSRDELDLIHYTTLSEAVSIVRQMDEVTVASAMDIFDSIMRIDSDIDFEENLLYAAVTVSCLADSKDWSGILSATDLDTEISNSQIIYLEKTFSANAHQVLDDRFDFLLISKAFGDIGLDLFYIPSIVGNLGIDKNDGVGDRSRFGLLKRSMGYLVPAGDMLKVKNIKESLISLDSEELFKIVCSRFSLTPDFFPFQAFLLVKIRDSVVLDDDNTLRNTVDFFCMDISSDVKRRILAFVSLFGDYTDLLPYEGYYKILFDHFSSEAKLNSEIVLDRRFNFILQSLEGKQISFESSPQARTFYLLLLRYGRNGVSQESFNHAVSYLEGEDLNRFRDGDEFSLSILETELSDGTEDWKSIIINTIRIYLAISSKDAQSLQFLSYITSILSHRSSLKTYLNKGFDSVDDLSDKEMYRVHFDRDTNSYYLNIGLSMFLIEEGQKTVPLEDSSFWKSLL